MLNVTFAVPGALETRTGGYAYARRLIAVGPSVGLTLDLLSLPDGFPFPSADALDETGWLLAAAPADRPLLVDGLAFGALPPRVIEAAGGPLAVLVHHPLARETGLDAATAEALFVSESEALRRADMVFCPSAVVAADLRENYAVSSDHLTITPPGLDRPSSPHSFSRDGEPMTILCVGAITPRKGQADLVEALARLDRPQAQLVLAGPMDRDPAYAEAVRGRAEALGVSERVTFLGALDDEALEAAYADADIFAIASRLEGYGMVYAEAMARGLPVVAYDIPAAREVTEEAAVLTPKCDPAALGTALATLLDDRAERARRSSAGLARADILPDWPDTAVRFREVLKHLSGSAR